MREPGVAGVHRRTHRRELLPVGGPEKRAAPIYFFFNDPAPTEIYTLSLHDAHPIPPPPQARRDRVDGGHRAGHVRPSRPGGDRKSTRLNFSHLVSSYAVFCWKK